MAREGRLSTDAGPLDEEDAQERYINALKKGLLKAFARLGISTLRSFRGSQPFEALGLSQDVIDRYFTGTPCSISGIGLETLARDAALRHAQAWDDPTHRLQGCRPCGASLEPPYRARPAYGRQ